MNKHLVFDEETFYLIDYAYSRSSHVNWSLHDKLYSMGEKGRAAGYRLVGGGVSLLALSTLIGGLSGKYCAVK